MGNVQRARTDGSLDAHSGLDRLCQSANSVDLQAFLVFFQTDREEDDRDALRSWIALEPSANLITVHDGHHDVQQDKIWGFDLRNCQGLGTAFNNFDNLLFFLSKSLIRDRVSGVSSTTKIAGISVDLSVEARDARIHFSFHFEVKNIGSALSNVTLFDCLDLSPLENF